VDVLVDVSVEVVVGVLVGALVGVSVGEVEVEVSVDVSVGVLVGVSVGEVEEVGGLVEISVGEEEEADVGASVGDVRVADGSTSRTLRPGLYSLFGRAGGKPRASLSEFERPCLAICASMT